MINVQELMKMKQSNMRIKWKNIPNINAAEKGLSNLHTETTELIRYFQLVYVSTYRFQVSFGER